MRKTLSLTVLLVLLLSLWSAVAQAKLSGPVVQKLKDCVVLIEVKLTLENGDVQEASGSGFVISKDGKIATNNHVVSMQVETEDGAETAETREVTVFFHPGTDNEKSYPAKVLRLNPDLDLAVIQVELATPTCLDLSDSEAIQETETVYAIGHPLGLREISMRQGSVTAHRTWEGHKYLEHDAMAESGNSGGPVVNEDGQVVGIHTLTLAAANMMTKFAIPSNVLRDWQATPSSQDPQARETGAAIKDLLEKSKLVYEAVEDQEGTYKLPYDNDINVMVHEYEEFMRVYVPLGEMPGGTATKQGQMAIKALQFNWTDPVGRLSAWRHDDKDDLYWECQVPMSMASPEFLKQVAQIAANQVGSWQKIVAGKEPGDPDELYPGGDKKEQVAQLADMVDRLRFESERDEDTFAIQVTDETVVRATIIKGMTWVFLWVGGMPGEGAKAQGENALKMLRKNWDDPFGRLSLDDEDDVAWECQVPFSFLTPDYLALLVQTGAGQAASFVKEFGQIPLNGGSDEEED